MPQALIFGINGQDGHYLANHLRELQMTVTGVSRSAGNWLSGDIADPAFSTALIRQLQPDYIFHLAAHSKTGHELLQEHQSTIVNGSLNILEAVYRYSPASKIFITGSGLQFENNGDPIPEKTAFRAADAYSLARIQSVYAARYYRTRGLKTYVGYLFHHDSPFRGPGHLNRRIADAAIAASAGQPVTLSVGAVKAEKEFGFAGDIVKGIFHLVQQDAVFEACIGTGKAYPVEKWLELCFSAVGLNWKQYVQPDESYQPEFRRMQSDPSLMRSLGWEHQTRIEELAAMMLKTAPDK